MCVLIVCVSVCVCICLYRLELFVAKNHVYYFRCKRPVLMRMLEIFLKASAKCRRWLYTAHIIPKFALVDSVGYSRIIWSILQPVHSRLFPMIDARITIQIDIFDQHCWNCRTNNNALLLCCLISLRTNILLLFSLLFCFVCGVHDQWLTQTERESSEKEVKTAPTTNCVHITERNMHMWLGSLNKFKLVRSTIKHWRQKTRRDATETTTNGHACQKKNRRKYITIRRQKTKNIKKANLRTNSLPCITIAHLFAVFIQSLSLLLLLDTHLFIFTLLIEKSR